MIQTDILVVGASIAGLAVAACLQKEGVDYTIIEKATQIASPWHNHYHRLHLHTNKRISSLPFKKLSANLPRYPGRQQVIAYLENYRQHFNICPLFDMEAISIKKENGYWITTTNNETFKSSFVIMATGVFGNPRSIDFKGMETFTGKMMHSCDYKSAADYTGQSVLVAGFGNSACEIAIDLFEQGAIPFMSVRSPVNIIPRDIAGVPILELSLLLRHFPARIADAITAPLLRLILGDITTLGLKKMAYGPFEQFKRNNSIPVLDTGVVKHIRKGHIKVYGGIDFIDGNTVHFLDGGKEVVDVLVACIGFNNNNAAIVAVEKNRFEDLKVCVDKQQYFGTDGLYFCGFWIGPTGQIREIASDAQKIATDIFSRKNI